MIKFNQYFLRALFCAKIICFLLKNKGDLCDIDGLEEEVFQDKNPTEIANEVLNYAANVAENSTKKKKKKTKIQPVQESSDVFDEINGQSDSE